jgi:membrane protease YdiL (CAAX protease family)
MNKLRKAMVHVTRVHAIVERQVVEPQPNILILLLAFSVPAWMLTVATGLLMRSDSYARLTQQYPDQYLLIFFMLQMLLSVIISAWLGFKYRAALWRPTPLPPLRSFVPVLLLLPLLLWYGLSGASSTIVLLCNTALIGDQEQVRNMLTQIHDQVWSEMAYGPSIIGVACSSASTLLFPVLEEIVFTGLLANAIYRKWGFSATVTVVPIVFSLAHLPAFGFGAHIFPLLLACGAYTAIRLTTGSLLYSLAGHLLVNCVILLPKWLIAVRHFRAGL